MGKGSSKTTVVTAEGAEDGDPEPVVKGNRVLYPKLNEVRMEELVMEFGETFDRKTLELLHQRFCDLYFRHTPDSVDSGGDSPRGKGKKKKKKKKRKKSRDEGDGKGKKSKRSRKGSKNQATAEDPADRTLGLDDFLCQPEFIHNPLRHRFTAGFEFEGDPVAIDLRAFIRAFCTLAEGANREEKLRFAFRVHDVDGDGQISSDDMLATLRSTILFDATVHTPERQEEILKEVVEFLMDEATEDGDDYLNQQEFQRIVRETEYQDKLTVRFKPKWNLALWMAKEARKEARAEAKRQKAELKRKKAYEKWVEKTGGKDGGKKVLTIDEWEAMKARVAKEKAAAAAAKKKKKKKKKKGKKGEDDVEELENEDSDGSKSSKKGSKKKKKSRKKKKKKKGSKDDFTDIAKEGSDDDDGAGLDADGKRRKRANKKLLRSMRGVRRMRSATKEMGRGMTYQDIGVATAAGVAGIGALAAGGAAAMNALAGD